MKRTKLTVFLAAALNLAAVFCLIWFAVPYLRHDTLVPNPDAMLPMQRWDGAGLALTIGLLPMIGANVIGFCCIFKKEQPLLLRLTAFLPAAAELLLVVHYLFASFS